MMDDMMKKMDMMKMDDMMAMSKEDLIGMMMKMKHMMKGDKCGPKMDGNCMPKMDM